MLFWPEFQLELCESSEVKFFSSRKFFIIFSRLDSISKKQMVTKFLKNFNQSSVRKAVVSTKLLSEITSLFIKYQSLFIVIFIHYFFLPLVSSFGKAFFFFLYGPKHFETIIILHHDWIFVAEYPWMTFFSLIFSTDCIFVIALSMNCLASVYRCLKSKKNICNLIRGHSLTRYIEKRWVGSWPV